MSLYSINITICCQEKFLKRTYREKLKDDSNNIVLGGKEIVLSLKAKKPLHNPCTVPYPQTFTILKSSILAIL